MNILFIAHHHSLFGANRSLLSLVDGLREKENVRLQVIVPGQGAFSTELKKRNIPCRLIPFDYNTRDASMPEMPDSVSNKSAALRPMLEVVRQTEPDIIYSNSSVIYYGAWLAQITRKPHVWHLREYGNLDYGLVYDLGTEYFRSLLKDCAFAIAISRSIAGHHLSGLDEKRKRVIYNGVARLDQCSTVSREAVRDGAPRLGILGLVHPPKGQHQAIEAVRLLRATCPDIVLRIAGTGDARYHDRLVEQVRRHGLEKNVTFTGFVADPLAWLKEEVDIVLMCSENEAFGRVTAEAMTQGIPVIGTATGGTPEIIADGHNGLLYDGRPEDLAAKIAQLAGNDADYRRLSRNALEDSKKRFTIDRYVEEIHGILGHVMRQAGRGSAAGLSRPPVDTGRKISPGQPPQAESSPTGAGVPVAKPARASCLEDIHAARQLAPLLDDGPYLPFSTSSLRYSSLATFLNDIVINNRKVVVEFGSGLTTCVIARLIQKNRLATRLYTVDENAAWLKIIEEALSRQQLGDTVTSIHAPLRETGLSMDGIPWYDTAVLDNALKGVTVDSVLVDGPSAWRKEIELSRFPALPYIHEHLAASSAVFLDDTDRPGERRILELWRQRYRYSFLRLNDSFSAVFQGAYFNIAAV
ncbi:glycosyltransferase [Opitutaceae bacterium TAV1]|nr:glycosyltransferase [Opitutaceae bacterium TAV1]